MKTFLVETLGILAASPLFKKLAADFFIGATDFELLEADEAVEFEDDQPVREFLPVISGSFNVYCG